MDLEDSLWQVFDELEIDFEQRDSLMSCLKPLKLKDLETYEHSIRVGIMGAQAARVHRVSDYLGFNDEEAHTKTRILFYPGLLHDIGKIVVNPEILKKKTGFNEQDREEMINHILYGYKMMSGIHDLSAEVILRVHPYAEVPETKFWTQLRDRTHTLITRSAEIVTLIDFYDAAKRENDRHSPGVARAPTPHEVEKIVLEGNRKHEQLIRALYAECVF